MLDGLIANLLLDHEDGEITTVQAASLKMTQLENATFNNTNIKTHIGILHESGHSEPWIMAMECLPSKYKTFNYSMRWGIECLFSDFKSRGFSVTKTHLVHTDRIERLILVLTIALYWAVSTGMQPKIKAKTTKKTKPIFAFLI